MNLNCLYSCLALFCNDTSVAGTLQSLAEHMNPLSVDHEHRTAIEKHWKEGVDYFRMEQPVVCHDGESIQVSLL